MKLIFPKLYIMIDLNEREVFINMSFVHTFTKDMQVHHFEQLH